MNIGTQTYPEAVREVLADRRWFPIDLDPQTGGISFVHTQNDAPTVQDLIDIQASPQGLPIKSVPAQPLWQALTRDQPPPQMRFIWHTAYCCSTAIAKALDVPGCNTSICEPLVLTTIALAKRTCDRERRGDVAWLADIAFRLLGRTQEPGMSVTLKPSPISNYLMPEAAKNTQGKMLFLYSDCRSFLLASMRYDETRRRYVRELFNNIRHDSAVVKGWPPERIATLTDLEVAGLVWQLQMTQFRAQLRARGARAVSLDCDAFLAAPREVTARIWDFLELPGDVNESPVMRSADGLATHMKYPQMRFDPAARLLEAQQLPRERREEIDLIVKTSAALFPEIANKLPLPNALATVEKDYSA